MQLNNIHTEGVQAFGRHCKFSPLAKEHASGLLAGESVMNVYSRCIHFILDNIMAFVLDKFWIFFH